MNTSVSSIFISPAKGAKKNMRGLVKIKEKILNPVTECSVDTSMNTTGAQGRESFVSRLTRAEPLGSNRDGTASQRADESKGDVSTKVEGHPCVSDPKHLVNLENVIMIEEKLWCIYERKPPLYSF